MDRIDITFNEAEFRSVIREYARVSKKTFADVLNKRAGNIALKAVQFSPRLNLSRLKKHEPIPTKSTYASRLHYALAAKRGARKGSGMQAAADKSYALSRKSTGYLKAGWIAAAQVFGKRTTSRVSASLRASSGGRKARSLDLVAEIFNGASLVNSTGRNLTGEIGLPALERAFVADIEDMRRYFARKMAQQNRRYSAA